MSGLILDGVRLLKGATLAGPLACGTNSATMGALSSSSISNSGTLSTGATTISGTLNCGVNAATVGALSSSSINNSGALSSASASITKLGINQATGTEALEVTGNIKPTGYYMLAPNQPTRATSSADAQYFSTNITPYSGGFTTYNVHNLGTLSNCISCKLTSTSNRVGINQDAGTEVLEVNGNVKATGLKLPTTGGTSSVLDFYQAGTVNNVAWSGPFSSTVNTNLTFVRIGNLVVLMFPHVENTANTANTITSTAGVLPTTIRPNYQIVLPIWTLDNLNYAVGSMTITTAGTITVNRPGFTNFSGVGSTGYFEFAATYSV